MVDSIRGLKKIARGITHFDLVVGLDISQQSSYEKIDKSFVKTGDLIWLKRKRPTYPLVVDHANSILRPPETGTKMKEMGPCPIMYMCHFSPNNMIVGFSGKEYFTLSHLDW